MNTITDVLHVLNTAFYLFIAITFLMTRYMDKNTASKVTVSSQNDFWNFWSSHSPNRLPKNIVAPICMAIPDRLAAVRNRSESLRGFCWLIFRVHGRIKARCGVGAQAALALHGARGIERGAGLNGQFTYGNRALYHCGRF